MKRLLSIVWLPVTLLIAWQAAAWFGVVNRLLFPPPSELIASAAAATRSGELAAHVAATLGRTIAGFVIGGALGVVTGLAMATRKPIRRSLEPIVSALNALPKLTLFPLLMLLVGIGEPARITLIAATALIITSLHVLDGVRNVHPAWVEVARNYGARRWTLMSTVYLPGCLPQMFTGLRLALSSALVIAISCELVNPSTGLGGMIWLAWQTFATDRLYVAIFVTGVLGVSLHALLRVLEARLVPWRPLPAGESARGAVLHTKAFSMRRRADNLDVVDR